MRKKVFIAISFFSVIFLLTSCAPKPSAFRTYCSDKQQELLERTEEEMPEKLIYRKNCCEAEAREFEITDANLIAEVLHSLDGILIEAKTNIRSTDNDNILKFVMENGDICSFLFNGHNFEARDGEFYVLSEDQELWELLWDIARVSDDY